MPNESVTGSCFCGQVGFHVDLPTEWCGHCHCSMCRRAHGAGYVTWVVVKRAQFAIDRGEDQLERFASSDHGVRSFCKRCGSSLFCELSEQPDSIDIVLANFDGPIDRPPSFDIHFDNRVDWMPIDPALLKLGGTSGMEPIKEDDA